MSSKVWVIEPRDPFIARDGKPFSVGTRASSLPFPFPSTTTGGVRTRAGQDGNGIFDGKRKINNQDLTQTVKDVAVRGSLLVELKNDEIETWLMPAPADALLLEDEQGAKVVKQLVPLNVGHGLTNINQPPHTQDNLAPVGFTRHDPRKPYGKAPRFWRWECFEKWLVEPDELTRLEMLDAKRFCEMEEQELLKESHRKIVDLGHDGATPETRTHVALDAETLTARDGQLFQTKGMEFTFCESKSFGKDIKHAKRLALAVCVDNDGNNLAANITKGLAPLGGERRIVAWRESTAQLPSPPTDLFKRITEQSVKACRIVLLTPAHFTNGSSPQWLRSPRHNVSVELAAIAHGRTQVVSGWDFIINRPKPTRRLAPMGTTLFLKLDGNDTDIQTWLEATWMQCVSDDETDRKDGFGLAAIGIWDGKPQEMKAGDSDEKTSN